MANYGPPGADRPDPWAGRRPDEAYGRPDDPRDQGWPADRTGWDEPAGHTGWDEPRGGTGWDDPTGPWPQPHPAYRQDEQYPPGGSYRYGDGHPPTGGYGQPTAGGYDRGGVPPAGAYPPDPRRPDDGYPPHRGYPGGEPAYLGNGRDAAPPVSPGERRGGRGRGGMIAVLAVLAVLVLGGGAALFYLAGSDGTDPDPVTALPSATAAQGDTPAAASDEPAEASPSALAPESSADPRFAKTGQCVRNDAPAGARPKLLITDCAPKTYQVLRRFDGATSGEKDAEAKCGRVEGYTDWYFYNSELDTLDFVLCLKLR